MVASSVDADKQDSIAAAQAVNADSYTSFHSGQIFREGKSFSGNERDCVWFGEPGGRFADLSALSGADDPNDGRAVVAADLDGDGDVDLFVHNIQRERHRLFRNELGGRSLKLRLRATSGQYEAVGAVVRVEPAGLPAVAQVLSRGAGFLSCQVPELVLGVADAKSARLSVVWPGGAREDFGSVELGAEGAALTLVEGTGEAAPFVPARAALPDPLPPGLKLVEADSVPVFEALDANGELVTVDVRALADGRPLFLNFWASYCAPCVKELPELEALHVSGEARVVALSMDSPNAIGAARQRLEAAGASFPAFYLPPELGEALDGMLDLERLTLPTTLVLTPEGKVDTILRGPLK